MSCLVPCVHERQLQTHLVGGRPTRHTKAARAILLANPLPPPARRPIRAPVTTRFAPTRPDRWPGSDRRHAWLDPPPEPSSTQSRAQRFVGRSPRSGSLGSQPPPAPSAEAVRGSSATRRDSLRFSRRRPRGGMTLPRRIRRMRGLTSCTISCIARRCVRYLSRCRRARPLGLAVRGTRNDGHAAKGPCGGSLARSDVETPPRRGPRSGFRGFRPGRKSLDIAS